MGETLAEIATMSRQPAGSDVVMPNSGAVEHAFAWIMKLFLQAASLPRPWLKPHVAVAPTGEVVFAW